MPDLEERVAALEAAVAMLTREAVQPGGITINTVRATLGLPPFREPWADSPGHVQVNARLPRAIVPGGIPGAA